MATPKPQGPESNQRVQTGKHGAPVICAWCKTVLNAGTGPPSHGICPTCLEQELNLDLIDLEEFLQGRSVVA
jgi:hypothetical protein